jgi:hypothetical protein
LGIEMTNNEPHEIEKPKGCFYLFGRGAISGGITGGIFLPVATSLLQNIQVDRPVGFLYLVLFGTFIIGMPVGGIGGLIVGSIWKHDRAPMLGGIIAPLVLITILTILVALIPMA